jgi:hypothetical protein
LPLQLASTVDRARLARIGSRLPAVRGLAQLERSWLAWFVSSWVEREMSAD